MTKTTSALSLLLLVSLPLSSLLASETRGSKPFDPQGNWSIRLENRCSGSSQYAPRSMPIHGSDFNCSKYLKKPQLPNRDELKINYNPESRIVTLTDGPSDFPRTIRLDSNRIGVSNVKLFPKRTQEAPGCDLETYVLEAVRFDNSDRMEYGYITVYNFVPQSKTKSCKPYLDVLKEAVQRRTATDFLLAMRDINAISVDRMQNLATINFFANYVGVRHERG
jgi:hypothetical protein